MTVLEILLLAAGAVLIAASFFIPEKEEEIDTDISELVREEVKKRIESESENMRKHVDDVVSEAVGYAEEKTERALERLTNEKIMAVNEYSDTVLDEINKNHKEVMFMYDMLNDKHKNLKNTVSEAEEVASKAQKTKEELKEVSETVSAKASEPASAPEPVSVKHSSQKAVNFFSGLDAPEASATVKSISEEEPVKNIRTLNWAELAVSDANEAEKKEAAKEGREPEKAIESSREKINREVVELAESGLEPIEIARRLKMGVGEVGLILGLHGR